MRPVPALCIPAAFLLGLLAGRWLSPRPAPAQAPPPPVAPARTAARPDPPAAPSFQPFLPPSVPTREVPPPAPPPTSPREASTPPPTAVSQTPPGPARRPPPLPAEWLSRLHAARSAAELMAIQPPEDKALAGAAYQQFTQCWANLLSTPDGKEDVLRSLTGMPMPHLVSFFNLFRGRGGPGFEQGGPAFAHRLASTLVEAIAARGTDAESRALFCNLLFGDLEHLSDSQLEALRTAMASDPDPRIRTQAGNLPRRW